MHNLSQEARRLKHWRLINLSIGTDSQARSWLVLAGLLCAAVFLASIPLPRLDHHLIGSDGLSYYAMLRSLVLDRDISLANDYRLLGVTAGKTITGLASCPFAIGTPLLWIPFFLLAHFISLCLAGIGLEVPTNGVSYIYESFVCLGTIGYATAGFVLMYHSVRRLFAANRTSTLWSVLAMWWATPAIYYVVAEPSMSHGVSIFAMALFFRAWCVPSPARPIRNWLLLGFCVGLVALVRWQDGALAIVPVVEVLWWVFRKGMSPRRAAYALSAFGLALVLTFAPQVLMWRSLYGAFLTIPQGSGFFRGTSPQVLATLFSTRHGLISWHPVYLLALLGLIPLWKKSRAMAILAAAMFAGEVYINGASTQWWAGDAFGARRLVSLVPLLAVPLAALLGKMKRPWVMSALILLVAWNGLCLVQYRLGFVSMSQALTLREMTIGRALLPLDVARRVLR